MCVQKKSILSFINVAHTLHCTAHRDMQYRIPAANDRQKQKKRRKDNNIQQQQEKQRRKQIHQSKNYCNFNSKSRLIIVKLNLYCAYPH